ncbi:unnamed protein product [Caenorhabditis nigoni]
MPHQSLLLITVDCSVLDFSRLQNQLRLALDYIHSADRSSYKFSIMSDNKEFKISQVFNNLSSLRHWRDGDILKRFGAFWRIHIFKYANGDIHQHLVCEKSQTDNWSIRTTCDVIVNGKPFKKGLHFEFQQVQTLWFASYILKKNYRKFGIDESVKIEFNVKIIEMTGIGEKKKSINFDDDVAKETSDVGLVVGDQEFYVNKMYLSFHSTYFKTLFSGNFSESEKSEIELKHIDPQDFQYFLELIYGISEVDDDTVSDILLLADFFDAKTAVKRCEDFLLNLSEKPLKEKFEAATQFKLEELTKMCIFGIKNRDEIRSVMPDDPSEIDHSIWKKLVEKSLTIS